MSALSPPTPTVLLSTEKRQDLSFADQQDLLAFIDKRNWFEAKLEALKALAPVYPFVHPVLVPDPNSTAGYVRAGADKSPWRLPDRAQLAAWVSERNSLQDEIDGFDDGDMERMKDKTRRMTRVPLTQPSTDLVEVTLDLILLIDQLLTALRQRGAILELALLRLQWDDLRYEVHRECESVQAEIEHVVSEAALWIPGVTLPDRPIRRQSRSIRGGRPALPSSPTSESASPTPSSPLEQESVTPPRSTSPIKPTSPHAKSLPGSPTKAGPPRTSLHISILRSQLVGLQTRQRNFAHNLVKRSSNTLDRMIDQAGRLKGLGGVDGPLEEDDKSIQGAIPDALIDLQEEMEAEAKDISDRVSFCSQFEAQCRQANVHLAASQRSQQIALELLAELERALTAPASSYKHAELARMYSEAITIFPPPINENFPRPSHPKYLSKDRHNDAVASALTVAHDSSQADLDLAANGLAFYASLLRAREALISQHSRVQALRNRLGTIVGQLERGTAEAPRPSLQEAAQAGGNYSEWLAAVEGWLRDGDATTREATDAHEATVLAIIQYKKALLGAPMAVKRFLPSEGVPDDLAPVVNDSTMDLITLARRCAELVQKVQRDSQALPLVMAIRADNADVAEDVEEYRRDIVRSINKAAWTVRPPSPLPDGLEEQVEKVASRANDIEEQLAQLGRIIGSSDAVAKLLAGTTTHVHDRIIDARRDLGMFTKVVQQAKIVREIQAEAANFLASIDSIREAVTDETANAEEQTAASDALPSLKHNIATWEASLAQRVNFVADESALRSRRRSSRRSTSGPLTPPLTPIGIHGDDDIEDDVSMPDFLLLDHQVRDELNHQSARVASALSNLVNAANEASLRRWAEPVTKACGSIGEAAETLESTLTDLDKRVQDVLAAKVEDKVQLALDLQQEGVTALIGPTQTLHLHLVALNDALSAPVSADADQHRVSEYFSHGDVSREAGLGLITKAENWQQEMNRVVADAQREQHDDAKAKAEAVIRQKAASAAADPKNVVKSLAARLESLQLESIVLPAPKSMKSGPRHRRLPSSEVAKRLTNTLHEIYEETKALAEKSKNSAEVRQLLDRVKRQDALVSDLDGLVVVSDAAAACDTAFSLLLDTIDENQDIEENALRTLAARKEAAAKVELFEQAAKPHRGDPRVASEHKRIQRAWAELCSLADNEPMSPSHSRTPSVTLSVALSVELSVGEGTFGFQSGGQHSATSSTDTIRPTGTQTRRESSGGTPHNTHGLGLSRRPADRLDTKSHRSGSTIPGETSSRLTSPPSKVPRPALPQPPPPLRRRRRDSISSEVSVSTADGRLARTGSSSRLSTIPGTPRAGSSTLPAPSAKRVEHHRWRTVTSQGHYGPHGMGLNKTKPRSSLSTMSVTPSNASSSSETSVFCPRVPKPRNSAPPGVPPSTVGGPSRTATSRRLAPTIPQPFNLSRSNSGTRLTRSPSGSTVLSEATGTQSEAAGARSDVSRLAPGPTTPASTRSSTFSHNRRSRLQVAVDRVLNTLDVDVPMAPAPCDDWKDESGRYWIGTGARARLCFCRILRSRTVMVRVGGGWTELSRYLLDHFSEYGETMLADSEVMEEWRTVPVSITSASLAASRSAHQLGQLLSSPGSATASLSASTSSVIGLSHAPRTPARARKSLPAFLEATATGSTAVEPDLHLHTPKTENRRLSSPLRTPGSLLNDSPRAGPGHGSPLVAVQFLRKASESPSVREKERERIRSAGRLFEMTPSPDKAAAVAHNATPLSPVVPMPTETMSVFGDATASTGETTVADSGIVDSPASTELGPE